MVWALLPSSVAEEQLGFLKKKRQLKGMHQGGVQTLANQDGTGKPGNFPLKSQKSSWFSEMWGSSAARAVQR